MVVLNPAICVDGRVRADDHAPILAGQRSADAHRAEQVRLSHLGELRQQVLMRDTKRRAKPHRERRRRRLCQLDVDRTRRRPPYASEVKVIAFAGDPHPHARDPFVRLRDEVPALVLGVEKNGLDSTRHKQFPSVRRSPPQSGLPSHEAARNTTPAGARRRSRGDHHPVTTYRRPNASSTSLRSVFGRPSAFRSTASPRTDSMNRDMSSRIDSGDAAAYSGSTAA